MGDPELTPLKRVAKHVSLHLEGGQTYVLLQGLRLPQGCVPDEVDALLAPFARDGYPSRLFLSMQVPGQSEQPNWQPSHRILDRTWVAYSYRVDGSEQLSLVALVSAHLGPFKRKCA